MVNVINVKSYSRYHEKKQDIKSTNIILIMFDNGNIMWQSTQSRYLSAIGNSFMWHTFQIHFYMYSKTCYQCIASYYSPCFFTKWNLRIGSVCPSVPHQMSETAGWIFLILGMMVDLCAPTMHARHFGILEKFNMADLSGKTVVPGLTKLIH